MFLLLDLDELISARPAAGHSFRNQVGCCHAIANLGLQSVGMMRQRMGPEDENIMKNLNNTEEIRKACQSHPRLKIILENSLNTCKELVESER